jgi:hypothetical protein
MIGGAAQVVKESVKKEKMRKERGDKREELKWRLSAAGICAVLTPLPLR